MKFRLPVALIILSSERKQNGKVIVAPSTDRGNSKANMNLYSIAVAHCRFRPISTETDCSIRMGY